MFPVWKFDWSLIANTRVHKCWFYNLYQDINKFVETVEAKLVFFEILFVPASCTRVSVGWEKIAWPPGVDQRRKIFNI